MTSFGALVEVAELFESGGPVMYAIAVASVVGLAVFIERIWALQRRKISPRSFVTKVFELVEKGAERDALLVAENESAAVARIFRAVLRRPNASIPFLKDAAEDAGRHEAARLERFLGALGSVASVSPLLGLLGTVTGMIAVFQQVATSGVGSPLEMASGIWESLLTTAFGLGTGIPALLGHRFLLGRVDGLVLELEEESLRLVELLGARPTSTTSAPPRDDDATTSTSKAGAVSG